MGGFLNLPVKKWVRVVVTRAVAIVPTVIVALIFNSSENELDRLSEWLNVLQSIQLPFALIPLLCLVSNTRVMGVFVIGTLTKVVAWSIAVLVLGINMYLLGVSVLSSLVHSVSAIIVLGISSAAYGAFICYLVLDPAQEDGNWSFLKNLFSRKEHQQLLELVEDTGDTMVLSSK
jgi:hypothetical protein